MSGSLLLKYARARDDAEFIWRISAALMVRAQEQEYWDVPPAARALINYIFANPMQPVNAMVNYVSTSPAIAANVVIDNGTVSTAAVPDGDIQFVVNEKFNLAAQNMFPGI